MENIQVLVRVRPLNYRETHVGAHSCVTTTNQTIQLDNKKEFTFDHVLGADSTQEDIYAAVGQPLIRATLGGVNSCVFAYGQTGAGKTYTMQGKAFEAGIQAQAGLQPRVISELFAQLASEPAWSVRCTYLEIYNEQLIDLLNDGKPLPLTIREDAKRVYVENLTEIVVSSFQDVLQLMMKGLANRHVSSTQMNLESSRSHSIFTLIVEFRIRSAEPVDSKVLAVRRSKLNFVDLAGSERQKQTSAAGERLKEAANINKSLTVLGLVINTLSESPRKFIPYRDSKLTFLLRESLGGNSRSFMIATISAASSSFQETLSTLKFASRAKNIKNTVSVNEDVGGSVESLKAEIRRLRSELSSYTIDQRDAGSKIKSKEEIEGELISQISTLNNQLSQSSQFQEQMNQEISQMREFYEQRINELETVHGKAREQSENGLVDKDNLLKSALDVQKEMQQKIETLNCKIRELNNEEQALRCRKNELMVTISQQQIELNQHKIEKQRLQGEVNRLEGLVKQMELGMENMQEDKQQQLQEFEKRLEQLNYQLQLSKDQNDTDQQTIEYHLQEMENLSVQLEDKQRDLEAVRLKFEQISSEHSSLKVQISELEGQLKLKIQENGKLHQDLQTSRSKLSKRILKDQKSRVKFKQKMRKSQILVDENLNFVNSIGQYLVDDGEIQAGNDVQLEIKRSLEQKFTQLQQQIAELNSLKNAMLYEKALVDKSYAQLQSDHQMLEVQKYQLEQDLAQNKINIEAVQRYEHLKTEFHAQKEKLQLFLQSFDIISQKLVIKENEVLKLKSELKLEQTQRARNLEEIDKLRTQKVNLANQVLEQEQTIQQLKCNSQNEPDEVKGRKQHDNLHNLMKANQKLSTDLQTLQRQHKILQDEKDLMQKKFEERLMFTGDWNKLKKEIGITQQLREQLEQKEQLYLQLQADLSQLEDFFKRINAKRYCSYQLHPERTLSGRLRQYFEFLEMCEQEFELKQYQLKTNLQLMHIEQANCNLIKEEHKMLKMQIQKHD